MHADYSVSSAKSAPNSRYDIDHDELFFTLTEIVRSMTPPALVARNVKSVERLMMIKFY
jgi:hypothetical protein